MDHGFNDKFEKMLGNNVTKKENNIEFHSERSYSRYVTFALPDGKYQSFNYAYLVTSEYIPDPTEIRIEFTTHTVLLKGEYLHKLYADILAHLPKLIECSNSRYNVLSEAKPVVNEIVVTAK